MSPRAIFASRATVVRRDELGMVAGGLNDMLGRLEHASDALQQRVREATQELVARNDELEESYQRVLGLQEALARAGTDGRGRRDGRQRRAPGWDAVESRLGLRTDRFAKIRRRKRAYRRERLEIVEAQLSQVTRVLRTMLDEARQPSPRATTSLAPLVERACAIARPRLARSGVHLDVRLEELLPDVDANAPQLELALLNLVTNALDAMPQGGTLRIRGAATEGGVRLEVSDSGQGIPADLLPHLFEPWVTTKPVPVTARASVSASFEKWCARLAARFMPQTSLVAEQSCHYRSAAQYKK